jgi:uncharacterized protein with GYD domain
MAKYLAQISYTVEGAKGLIKEGGSKRLEAVEQLTKDLSPPAVQLPLTMSFCSMEAVDHLVKGVGGTLEAFYYAFGDYDLIIIMELPDNASAAALSLAVTASGASKVRTTVLLSPEEIDQATKKSFNYRPPGQ